MEEKIYTIPVNGAFSDTENKCAFCKLREDLEKEEVDLILGPSLMEPDVRAVTNKKGFCRKHYLQMLSGKNKLGLALMLESHLEQVKKNVDLKNFVLSKDPASGAKKYTEELLGSCYICSRTEDKFQKMVETAVYLWGKSPEFREKAKSREMYCMEHFLQFLNTASIRMSKKDYCEFLKIIFDVQKKYIDKLSENVSWFCKKFDYRYNDEPWKDSKDSPEKTIEFLCGGN